MFLRALRVVEGFEQEDTIECEAVTVREHSRYPHTPEENAHMIMFRIEKGPSFKGNREQWLQLDKRTDVAYLLNGDGKTIEHYTWSDPERRRAAIDAAIQKAVAEQNEPHAA